MRRPNIERAISLAVFYPWKPSAQGRISPTPTLQYSRCSWQCIMKIGRETCYPLPWRAFKSWINFFLPSLPESLPIFQTFLAPVWAHTHTHRCGKVAPSSEPFASRFLSTFLFSLSLDEEERNMAGIFFINGDFLLFRSWFNFSLFYLKWRVISPGLKGEVERGNPLDENGQLTSLNL